MSADAARRRRLRHVLVVDDDTRVRRALKRLIVAMGFNVVTAADGAAALRLVNTHAPDVVCLDLQMPRMSGWDVLRALHASHPALPVIIVSAADHIRVSAELRRMGAFDVLTKPVDAERLESSIVAAITK